jgi:hypothetical protein
MDVWIPLLRGPKGLDDGDHSGPGLGLFDRCDHHLVNGFVSEPCELAQELSMVEEEGPEHFRYCEYPLGVRDFPESVSSFEPIVPQALEGFEMGIEELKERAGAWIAGPVSGGAGVGPWQRPDGQSSAAHEEARRNPS